MPIVSTFAAPPSAANDSSPPIPENEVLWMPSEVDQKHWPTGLAAGLAALELRLRESEAQDALHQVGWR